MAKILSRRECRPCRLVPQMSGRHQFGGHSNYTGVLPPGEKTPLQLVMLFDLQDPLVPFRADGLKRLPIFYPFKYGQGGGEVQYEVLDDESIRIIYISESHADSERFQYVRVDELPRMAFRLELLTYEQARALAMADNEPSFDLNEEDKKLYKDLKKNPALPLVRVGGDSIIDLRNGTQLCHNSSCGYYKKGNGFWPVVTLPPIPVNGTTSFWHEFEDASMHFCFGVCIGCRTIFAFNVSS